MGSAHTLPLWLTRSGGQYNMDTISKDELLKNRSWQKYWLPGLKIDIQLLENLDVRLHTNLVGYNLGEYLLLSFSKDCLTVKQNIVGMMVICRFLLEGELGECYAFKSEITHLCLRPYRNLYLSFPTEVYKRPFREDRRLHAHIEADISLCEDEQEIEHKFHGCVTDISEGGCCFSFDEDLLAKNVKNIPVHIYFAKTSQSLCLSGTIRSCRNLDGHMAIGIQFEQGIRQHNIEALIEQPAEVGGWK